MKSPRKLLAAGITICLACAALGAARARVAFAQDAGPAPSLRKPPQGAPPQAQTPPQTPPPQQPPAPSSEADDTRGRIRTTVSLVVVPVTVKDSAGELVTDLQQNDFRIFEDGVEQPIAQFSAEAVPLSAAILIDDDLKTGTAEKVQKTLETLAGAFSASDEVSLWRFDQVPEQVSEDFIADNDKLLTQLEAHRPQQLVSRGRLLHDDERTARQHAPRRRGRRKFPRKPTDIPTRSTSTTRSRPRENSSRTGRMTGAGLFS